jgi:hypothetical protein
VRDLTDYGERVEKVAAWLYGWNSAGLNYAPNVYGWEKKTDEVKEVYRRKARELLRILNLEC